MKSFYKMLTDQEVLKLLVRNAENMKCRCVKKILLLFEVERFIIGDSCDRLAKIKICRSLFPEGTIDLCSNQTGFASLVKNNPYLNNYWFAENLNDVDFIQYDIVICVSYKEPQLLNHLRIRYADDILNERFLLAVFSARTLYDVSNSVTFLFPSFHDYYNTAVVPQSKLRNEIYIGNQEREWATRWLTDHGVTEDEILIVVVDNSNSRTKLLSHGVYFSLLKFFLSISKVKILIFDENGLGKKKFYGAWLGRENAARFVFAERTSLRESLCLIGSPFVKFVFGPCTGLLHCASGIYNVSQKQHGQDHVIPAMLVYRGNQKGVNDNPYRWWGNTLADCVLIKRDDVGRGYVKLLTDEDRDINVALTGLGECNEFSAEMLVDFINNTYRSKLFPAKACER